MYLGRFVFGIGGESLAVAQNTYAVVWFKEKELNLVFGLQLSMARIVSIQSDQFFYYTRCVKSKRVTSLRGSSSYASLRMGNTAPFEEMSQRWQAVINYLNLFDLNLKPATTETNALPRPTIVGV